MGEKIINFNKFTININTELFALTVFNSLNRTSSLKVTCLSAYAGRTVLDLLNEKKKQLMRVKKLLIGGVCL